MGIMRAIHIVGTLIVLGALVMIGHSYNTTMTAPAGAPGPRFVSGDGSEMTRASSGQPTMVDSIQLMWANLTGKETKPSNGLKDLRRRTALSRAPAPGSIEAASREIDFWTNFTAKLGFTGP